MSARSEERLWEEVGTTNEELPGYYTRAWLRSEPTSEIICPEHVERSLISVREYEPDPCEPFRFCTFSIESICRCVRLGPALDSERKGQSHLQAGVCGTCSLSVSPSSFLPSFQSLGNVQCHSPGPSRHRGLLAAGGLTLRNLSRASARGGWGVRFPHWCLVTKFLKSCLAAA